MSLRVYPFTYTGDGTDNRDITGSFPFPVALVWVKPADTTANDGAITWTAIGADRSYDPSGATSMTANFIQALNPSGVNGIQVGSAANVNSNGVAYYGVAFNGDSTCFHEGTYTGNGTTSNPVTGVGFQPDLLIVRRNGGSAGRMYWVQSDQASLWTDSNGAAGFFTMDADGFTVTSTSSQVNQNANTYYFVAIKLESGFSSRGQFTGNATDNRAITGIGFQPEVVIEKANSGGQGFIFRTTANTGDDTSIWISGVANAADFIQSLDSDGFTVGTQARANRNATTMTWYAFKDNPPGNGNFFPFF